MSTTTSLMSKRDQLRRVVILCGTFARNLAYHRVGQLEEFKDLFDLKNESANFWRVANSNCIDMCVLEWYKLFGDKRGKHYWANVVTDRSAFKKGLLERLGKDETGLENYVRQMRFYRDKFLAHLDSDNEVDIPGLDTAKQAVWFYHAHVIAEAQDGDMAGLPLNLDAGYEQSEREARAVFERNGTTTSGGNHHEDRDRRHPRGTRH